MGATDTAILKVSDKGSKLEPREPADTCNGRRADGSGYCGQAAGWGTDHPGIGRCKRHGGSTALYMQKVERMRAEAAVGEYGLPVATDPFTALEELLAQSNGYVTFLDWRVQTLPPEQHYGEVGGGPQAIPSSEPHVLIRMLAEERDRLAKIAKTCIDAGIAKRRVELAEAQGQQLATTIKTILERLGVLEHPDAPQVVREELQRLAGGS